MEYLKSIEMEKRGDRVRLVRRKVEGDRDLLVFTWMDHERRYLFLFRIEYVGWFAEYKIKTSARK